MRKSRQLRQMVQAGKFVSVIGAQSGLNAILAEEAGFDAVWSSSFEVSAFRGLPDVSLLTMTDFLRAAIEADRGCKLPVIADCDTGFGDALNVVHMVREYEAAGIAAVSIEDKVFPKVNSFSSSGQILEDREEFARRIAMAKAAQRGKDFFVIARTEALIAGCRLDEALRRANAYADAGADAILIHSKEPTPTQVKEFLAKWGDRKPVAVVPTTYHSWHIDDMKRSGVTICIYANHGLRATVAAVRQTLASIRSEGTSSKAESQIASIEDIFRLQRLEKWLSYRAVAHDSRNEGEEA
jgi:phosphoenolpyruvate phosphomutase